LAPNLARLDNPREPSMLPGHLHGVSRILVPSMHQFSPAVGSVVASSTLTPTFARLGGSTSSSQVLPESLLTRDLFLLAGGNLRATTTRSKPGTHLDPSSWGSLVGLAMSRADRDTVQVAFGKHGIATRRGNQSNPPPSFGRCELLQPTTTAPNVASHLPLSSLLPALSGIIN